MAQFPGLGPDVSAKRTARRRRRADAPTFIQRSRAVSSEQKAIYHQVLGAGPRHVVRPFFTLGETEQDEIGQALEGLIQARLPE